MYYTSSASLPTIVQLSTNDISDICDILNNFMILHQKSSLAGYADFFSLLNLLDNKIIDQLKNNSYKKLSISQSPKNVNEIIAFINSHITEPITLNFIASEFHLNKDYIGRLFKEHTHATIGHYISVQRANLAQSMLCEGQTVTEVQEKLGFTSYAYFFKFFKKMIGISPSQYRKNNML